MEKWFNKNYKWVIIILLFFLLIKTTQSCNRKSSLKIQEKKLSLTYQTTIDSQKIIIDSLVKDNLTKEFLIKDLSSDLKVAGVMVNEAQKRADAVQKTASSVKTNTTIQVNSSEKDKK